MSDLGDLGTALYQMTHASRKFDQIAGVLCSHFPGHDWKKILISRSCVTAVDISQTDQLRSYWLNPSVLAVKLRGIGEFELADKIELAYAAACIAASV